MGYNIAFDETNDIVIVAYSGSMSLSERMEVIEEVCFRFEKLTPLKIVEDVRSLSMDMTYQEQLDFGEYISVHPMLIRSKIAVLHGQGENPNVIVDAAAFNGGVRLAEFTCIKEAKQWLIG